MVAEKDHQSGRSLPFRVAPLKVAVATAGGTPAVVGVQGSKTLSEEARSAVDYEGEGARRPRGRRGMIRRIGSLAGFIVAAIALASPTVATAQMAITYDYDVQGRLKKVNDAAGWSTVYTFDPASNRARVNVISQFPQSWTAASLLHNVGRAEAGGWSASVSDPVGVMVYGPYATNVSVGDHVATFRLLVDDNTSDNNSVVIVDVNDADGGGQLASHSIARQEFRTRRYYEIFELPFTLPSGSAGHRIEFRVTYLCNSYIRVDKVGYR